MIEQNKKVRKKRNEEKEEIIGGAKYHREFESTFLSSKRDLIVWLPPGYDSRRNKNKQYPVLYMHDGQNILDPKTSYAGKDWRIDEILSSLIKKKKIKEIIVVGIYNSPDRLDEYSLSEKGNNYLQFLAKEVKPFVDLTYRTMPERENTAVMGSSMGGLISFYAGWFYPEIFSMVACMSSSFYYNDDKSLRMVEEYDGPKKSVKFYIDHGEDGLIRGQKMFSLLSQKGYIIGTDVDYFYAPGAEHNEAEWASRLERPLLFFFKK